MLFVYEISGSLDCSELKSSCWLNSLFSIEWHVEIAFFTHTKIWNLMFWVCIVLLADSYIGMEGKRIWEEIMGELIWLKNSFILNLNKSWIRR